MPSFHEWVCRLDAGRLMPDRNSDCGERERLWRLILAATMTSVFRIRSLTVGAGGDHEAGVG